MVARAETINVYAIDGKTVWEILQQKRQERLSVKHLLMDRESSTAVSLRIATFISEPEPALPLDLTYLRIGTKPISSSIIIIIPLSCTCTCTCTCTCIEY